MGGRGICVIIYGDRNHIDFHWVLGTDFNRTEEDGIVSIYSKKGMQKECG